MSLKDKAFARSTDPNTSKDAADRVSVKIGSIRHRVLDRIAEIGPCSDDVLSDAFPDLAGATVRGRRSELVHGGYVEQTNKESINIRGNRCKVWRITDLGLSMLETYGRYSYLLDQNPPKPDPCLFR